MELDTKDWLAVARPRVAKIAAWTHGLRTARVPARFAKRAGDARGRKTKTMRRPEVRAPPNYSPIMDISSLWQRLVRLGVVS